MNTNVLKFIAVVGLYGLWAWLVYIDKAPAPSFIEAIRDALIGLGVYHTTLAQPDVPCPVPPPPAPLPAPTTLKESP